MQRFLRKALSDISELHRFGQRSCIVKAVTRLLARKAPVYESMIVIQVFSDVDTSLRVFFFRIYDRLFVMR